VVKKALAILALLVSLRAAWGAAEVASEYAVKAAFLYSFTNFVDWPESVTKEEDSFVIGVVGQDPFGRLLDDAVKNKTVRGKPIIIRRWSSLKDVEYCNIAFISPDALALDPFLSAIKDRSILTVSDAQMFVERGGDIAFVTEGAKIRFDVNVTAAREVGISVSSKLLSIARGTR